MKTNKFILDDFFLTFLSQESVSINSPDRNFDLGDEWGQYAVLDTTSVTTKKPCTTLTTLTNIREEEKEMIEVDSESSMFEADYSAIPEEEQEEELQFTIDI